MRGSGDSPSALGRAFASVDASPDAGVDMGSIGVAVSPLAGGSRRNMRAGVGAELFPPADHPGRTAARYLRAMSLKRRVGGAARPGNDSLAPSRAEQPLPPDTPREVRKGGGREWIQSLLAKFGPVQEKASNITVLDFEKPLVELDNRINEVRRPPRARGRVRRFLDMRRLGRRRLGRPRAAGEPRPLDEGQRNAAPRPLPPRPQVRRVAEENGVDVSSQIAELEARASALRQETYSRLTPTQRLQASAPARAPARAARYLIARRGSALHDRGSQICRREGPAVACDVWRACLWALDYYGPAHESRGPSRPQVARHPNRPTFLDIALNITDKFVELHGDRGGLDDPAVVCGLGSIDGVTFMMIGHQKGRNTKENIYRNFGMPQPNGYRKALRFMRHADKFGFLIVTFVDTPGAYAGKTAEELGQGEAIAVNLREMFGFRVPIVSFVIGEGGSGGALAIGCANRSLILQNAVYYVASPEACAAILWKSRDKAGTATEALRITSSDLVRMGIMDEIVPEPQGGAHANPMEAFPAIREALMRTYRHYQGMTEDEIRLDRYAKFRQMGLYTDFIVRGGERAKALAVSAAGCPATQPRASLAAARAWRTQAAPRVVSAPPPGSALAGACGAVRQGGCQDGGGHAVRDPGGGGAGGAARGRGREVGRAGGDQAGVDQQARAAAGPGAHGGHVGGGGADRQEEGAAGGEQWRGARGRSRVARGAHGGAALNAARGGAMRQTRGDRCRLTWISLAPATQSGMPSADLPGPCPPLASCGAHSPTDMLGSIDPRARTDTDFLGRSVAPRS